MGGVLKIIDVFYFLKISRNDGFHLNKWWKYVGNTSGLSGQAGSGPNTVCEIKVSSSQSASGPLR